MSAHSPATGYDHWLPDDGEAGNCGRCHQPVTWDPLTERYIVTRKPPRVAVHPSRILPTFTGGTERRFESRRAWTVWLHGLRLPGWYVVDHPTGLTVIRDGEMVTSWHAGIHAGDLARLVVQ